MAVITNNKMVTDRVADTHHWLLVPIHTKRLRPMRFHYDKVSAIGKVLLGQTVEISLQSATPS